MEGSQLLKAADGLGAKPPAPEDFAMYIYIYYIYIFIFFAIIT